jgi:hypothetical protein
MAILTPSGLYQNRTDHHAVTHRLRTTSLLRSDSTSARLFSPGGIHFRPSNLKVLAQASPNMTTRITRGMGLITGVEANVQGTYEVYNDAEFTPITHAASHATLERVDIVYMAVDDSFYSTANNAPNFGVVQGANAAVGTAVANLAGMPVNSEGLAQVLISPGVTSIVQAKIFDSRRPYCAQGGIKPIRSFESGAAGLDYGDMRYWNGRIEGWNAEATTGWRPVSAAPVDNVQYGGTFTYGTYTVAGTMATIAIADPGYPYYIEGEASLNMSVDNATRWDCVARLDTAGGTYLGHGICTFTVASRIKTNWFRSAVLTGAHSVLFRMEKGFGTNGAANSEGIMYLRVVPQPPAANAGVWINV